MQHLTRPEGTPPVNGYSHAVRFSGQLVAVSGQVPLDAAGQVFVNLATVLAAAGSGLDRVVKLTVYLTDLGDLPVFRTVRDEFISADAAPASSRRHLRCAPAPPRARTVPMVRGSSAPLRTAHWCR